MPGRFTSERRFSIGQLIAAMIGASLIAAGLGIILGWYLSSARWAQSLNYTAESPATLTQPLTTAKQAMADSSGEIISVALLAEPANESLAPVATGWENLRVGQAFKLRLLPRQNGYLYLLASARNGALLPVSATALKEGNTEPTNFFEAGREQIVTAATLARLPSPAPGRYTFVFSSQPLSEVPPGWEKVAVQISPENHRCLSVRTASSAADQGGVIFDLVIR